MTANEIRETFLRYFEKQGHRRVPSSPLLPANDPTLLFANAGMNQFKDAFLGTEKRDYTRATSSQKCLRAGGKHNDLDDVGDATHHTFFEMLGNFSFGDYFKRDAIRFALELLLDEYKIPRERLWFTVFETDDEAAELWAEAGVPRERILRFGAKDNFWQMGDTGPCGPCSEIHYYRGEHPEDPEFNRPEYVNRDGSPTVEIWNLVFMQYDRDSAGNLTPLPKPSVDTGAGLERATAVLQDAPDNYETDLLRPIVDFVARLADRHYEPDTKNGHAMRVITDHARATAFSIADNILPGNEGRNYVLRKIMRRAIYHGRHALQLDDLFFHKVTDFVADLMREAYPELEASREFIERMVRLEEERFGSTLTTGLQKLEALFASTPEGRMPPMKDLARLYDTFGTPRDLIRVVLGERGFSLEEDSYNESFDAALRSIQHQTILQPEGIGSSEAFGTPTLTLLPPNKMQIREAHERLLQRVGSTEFTGYETLREDGARVLAI